MLKHGFAAANKKITRLETLVQELRDDIPSLGKFKDDIKTDLVGRVTFYGNLSRIAEFSCNPVSQIDTAYLHK